MESYLLTLHVTEEQERAIELLYTANKWIFRKTDLKNPSQKELTTSCNTSLMDITAKGIELNDLSTRPHEEKKYDMQKGRENENNSRNAMFAQESPLNLYNQHVSENLKHLNGLDFSTSKRIGEGTEINEVPYPHSTSSQCKDTSIADKLRYSEMDYHRKKVSAESDKFIHPVTEKNLLSRRDLYIYTGEMVLTCLGKLNYICPQKSNFTRDECEFINEILSNLFSVYSEYTSAQKATPSMSVISRNILVDKNVVKTEDGNLMQRCNINPSEGLATNLRHSKGIQKRKSKDLGNTQGLGTFNKKSWKTKEARRTQVPNTRKHSSSKGKIRKLQKYKAPQSQQRKSKTIQNETTHEIQCDNVATNALELSGADSCNGISIISVAEQDRNVVDKTSQINEKTEFLCDLCGAKFSEKKVLNGHRKYVHTENRPEQCEICDKRFKTKSQLANHKLVHKSEQELDLSCEVCGKRFRRAGTLKDHVRRHKKDYSEFCMICGKGFYRNYWLQEHMRTHSGLKPYDCRICGFKTALKCNLNKHMKTHRA